LVLQVSGLLSWSSVRPGDALQPRRHHRAKHLAGVLGFPFGFEPVKVPPDLRCPLRHDAVERLQLDHLTGDGIEDQSCCASVLAGWRGEAMTAVPIARIAPCCLNYAAVSSARHFPAAKTLVPICM